MAMAMHCKKIHQLAQDQTISLTEKGLIFRQTYSLVLRIPLWLMDFLMESTSFFTAWVKSTIGFVLIGFMPIVSGQHMIHAQHI
jgi:hypothetical protein